MPVTNMIITYLQSWGCHSWAHLPDRAYRTATNEKPHPQDVSDGKVVCQDQPAYYLGNSNRFVCSILHDIFS